MSDQVLIVEYGSHGWRQPERISIHRLGATVIDEAVKGLVSKLNKWRR